jgi:predicted RNA-binding protein with PIN domain
MRIVIDGYNLLKALPDCRGIEAHDPDAARGYLLVQLGRYRWLRGHQITVVFDGWIGGQPIERRSQASGVEVIYSQRGEQADAVIRRLAPQVAHQGVVVTSDRTLASHVQQAGADVIGSVEFGERLRKALVTEEQGTRGQRSNTPDPSHTARHKGTARRASRAERERERKLRNL